MDLPIPGNDDGLRSIEIIFRHLADAVIEGKTGVAPVHEETPASPVAAAASAVEEAPAAPAEEPAAEEAPAEEAVAEEAAAYSGRSSCRGNSG